MPLEHIHGVPQRIADLKAKLEAREGKSEYKENCEAIRAEIDRLEAATINRPALEEFLESQAVASEESSGEVQ